MESTGEHGIVAEAAGFRVAIEANVAVCTLARPPGNRVNLAMMDRMRTVFEALRDLGQVRTIWLKHEGDDFCHGADLMDPGLSHAFAEGPSGQRRVAELGADLIRAWRELPMPTVVSGRGRIIGAGACLFVTADFRVVARDAQLCFPEVDRGLHLSWGIIPELVHGVGLDVARRLALLGEPLPATEFPAGLAEVTAEGELMEATSLLVRRLASKAPLALVSIKAALREVCDGATDVASRDPDRFVRTAGSKDFQEAVRAFLQKRKPEFSGE